MACHIRIEDIRPEFHSKRCKECHRGLPITSFYAQTGMKDGHSSKCKRCMINAALTRKYGMPAKRAKYLRTHQCPDCEGLSWRRRKPACRTCLEPYEPEDMGFSRQEIIERRKWDQSWIYSR